MKSVNIHDAKTHFSRLIDEVSTGDSIVIAKSGTPVAKLVPLDATAAAAQKRTGFLIPMAFPNDFDRMVDTQIGDLFAGRE
jgi:prevent-host-death family protein